MVKRRYRAPSSVREALRRQQSPPDDQSHQKRQRARWKDMGKLLVFILLHALTNGK
jgi:hypothetical protein